MRFGSVRLRLWVCGCCSGCVSVGVGGKAAWAGAGAGSGGAGVVGA